MGEYDFRPQDDFGHSMDDENDLSNYRPGMGAMVAMGGEDMGYESGSSDFEAFDMGHTWSPDMLPGMPHGLFDEPDKMGDDAPDPDAADPSASGLTDDYAQDVYAAPSIVYERFYGMPHRPGWGAWQRPHPPVNAAYHRR